MAGEQLIELLTPKRTIFLPPRGGWPINYWPPFWLYSKTQVGFDEIDTFESSDFDNVIVSTGTYDPVIITNYKH